MTSSVMRVYLDTNVYCRPFDDQTQPRIHQEAEAFVQLLDLAQRGEIELVGSEVLTFEMSRIQDSERRMRAGSYLALCAGQVMATEEQLRLAQGLERRCGLKARDALHLAAACYGRAAYCVTCDDKALRRAVCGQKITEQYGTKVILIGPQQLLDALKAE